MGALRARDPTRAWIRRVPRSDERGDLTRAGIQRAWDSTKGRESNGTELVDSQVRVLNVRTLVVQRQFAAARRVQAWDPAGFFEPPICRARRSEIGRAAQGPGRTVRLSVIRRVEGDAGPSAIDAFAAAASRPSGAAAKSRSHAADRRPDPVPRLGPGARSGCLPRAGEWGVEGVAG